MIQLLALESFSTNKISPMFLLYGLDFPRGRIRKMTLHVKEFLMATCG
jgi:hypothetical protein